MPSFHKSLPRFRAFAIVTALALACLATPTSATETASIVIDAKSGAILHGEAIDRAVHPASLAKMMTLYLTFEALKGRAFRAGTRLKTSAHAARQLPARLGLRRGDAITVQDRSSPSSRSRRTTPPSFWRKRFPEARPVSPIG